MILDSANAKRLILYFMYDKDGIVDDYVPYMLRELKKIQTEILVVCNGKLTRESREKLQEVTPNVLVRENKGFVSGRIRQDLNITDGTRSDPLTK